MCSTCFPGTGGLRSAQEEAVINAGSPVQLKIDVLSIKGLPPLIWT